MLQQAQSFGTHLCGMMAGSEAPPPTPLTLCKFSHQSISLAMSYIMKFILNPGAQQVKTKRRYYLCGETFQCFRTYLNYSFYVEK